MIATCCCPFCFFVFDVFLYSFPFVWGGGRVHKVRLGLVSDGGFAALYTLNPNPPITRKAETPVGLWAAVL